MGEVLPGIGRKEGKLQGGLVSGLPKRGGGGFFQSSWWDGSWSRLGTRKQEDFDIQLVG